MARFEVRAADASTLRRAYRLETQFGDECTGIFPRGGAQYSHFRRLARFGMLEETGEWGRDFDGMIDDDVQLFKLTPAGRLWVQQQEQIQAA